MNAVFGVGDARTVPGGAEPAVGTPRCGCEIVNAGALQPAPRALRKILDTAVTARRRRRESVRIGLEAILKPALCRASLMWRYHSPNIRGRYGEESKEGQDREEGQEGKSQKEEVVFRLGRTRSARATSPELGWRPREWNQKWNQKRWACSPTCLIQGT